MKNGHENKSLTAMLADFLIERGASVHDELAAIQEIAPFALNALARNRRRAVLVAFAKLPIAQFVKEICAARDSVKAEMEKAQRVKTELAALRQREAAFAVADELSPDCGEVAAAALSRENWLKNVTALREANNRLAAALHSTGDALQRLAWLQDGGSQNIGCIGSWKCGLSNLDAVPFSAERLDFLGQAERLLGIAGNALDEIKNLQAGQVPGVGIGTAMRYFEDLRFAPVPDETP